jgi:excisionase family DNA binding protein
MARASAEANRSEVRTVKRDQQRLLNIEQVADLLGVEVRHIRHLVFERRIPFIKWGHLLRFDPDEVAAWIEDHRQRPAS